MITLVNFQGISEIFLTVSLIILLLFYEFGGEYVKKHFMPFIVVMTIVFAVIASLSIIKQLR